jgi:hypothetical protein
MRWQKQLPPNSFWEERKFVARADLGTYGARRMEGLALDAGIRFSYYVGMTTGTELVRVPPATASRKDRDLGQRALNDQYLALFRCRLWCVRNGLKPFAPIPPVRPWWGMPFSRQVTAR